MNIMDINQISTKVKYEDIDLEIQGRLSIEYKGKVFESLWLPKSNADTLFVVLNGARPVNSGPVFKRWSWSKFFPGSMLNIDDPMYVDYPDLLLGWYYGSSKYNYCEYIVDIVSKFKELYFIKNVIFYASSGGGTAAIHCGSLLYDSMVICINPQIYIGLYEYDGFQKITGINLLEKDVYSRNDCGTLMIKSARTKYILCENICSETDRKQITELYRSYNCDEPVSLGLKEFNDNVLVWNYEAESFSPFKNRQHNSQEWESMFWAIYRLKDYWEKKEIRSISDWNEEYLNYCRFWKERWKYETTIKRLKRSVRLCLLNGIPPRSPKYSRDIYTLDGCKSNKWKHIKLDYEFQPNSNYCIGILGCDELFDDNVITVIVKDVISEAIVDSIEISSENALVGLFLFDDISGLEIRIYPTRLGMCSHTESTRIYGIKIWEL